MQSFVLAVRLGPGVAAAEAQPEELAAAVGVEVASPELPARLRLRMGQELAQLWRQSGPGELIFEQGMRSSMRSSMCGSMRSSMCG